ncbi:NIPSNAP family protein [Aneurinibacillus sp. Ricciae_BoGa-3]|uniref:NIPSNAP family protein n=1 Tax=Aneurinibacillus sp. Ricciae_BoGa-3 TaxID=3022697 RepID=UPI002340A0E3|nr:NIPSNAP family protein [Aneurinibacillus sp. Ricciae_BoGa-3]WCK56442.1 NIPSNAP family protein [Aneurinibacillus sp. Ricciae_BoGa-3]
MIYEMRTYTVKIGKMQEYLGLFEDVGHAIISKYAKLVGYWYTEIGELNQIVHVWAYESLDVRAERRKALYEDPEWLEKFIAHAMPLLEKQENKILYATNFSPLQ